jgi:hypothetical protein
MRSLKRSLISPEAESAQESNAAVTANSKRRPILSRFFIFQPSFQGPIGFW